MGRGRFVWLLSLPLYAGAWLAAHWVMHAAAPERPKGAMVSDAGPHAFTVAPLCAACASMMLLLLVILIARPAVALGYELAERLRAGSAPLVWPAPVLQHSTLEPERARPPVLATCHSGRAPPRQAFGLA